jgi:hypothetical protein
MTLPEKQLRRSDHETWDLKIGKSKMGVPRSSHSAGWIERLAFANYRSNIRAAFEAFNSQQSATHLSPAAEPNLAEYSSARLV